jgi:hypothetical protein
VPLSERIARMNAALAEFWALAQGPMDGLYVRGATFTGTWRPMIRLDRSGPPAVEAVAAVPA